MKNLLVLAIVLGLLAWLLTYLPIPEPFHTIIFVVMVLAFVWELLAAAGMTSSFIGRGPSP